MNQNMIAIAVCAVIVVATIVCGAIIICFIIKAPERMVEAHTEALKSGAAIRLIAILTIIGAVVSLTWINRISGEAAVATLSAIAGYVLGNGNARKGSGESGQI